MTFTYIEYTRQNRLSVCEALEEMQRTQQVPPEPTELVECTRVIYGRLNDAANNPVRNALMHAFPEDGHNFSRVGPRVDKSVVIRFMLGVMQPPEVGRKVLERINSNSQNLNAETLWSFQHTLKVVEAAHSEHKMDLDREQSVKDLTRAARMDFPRTITPRPTGPHSPGLGAGTFEVHPQRTAQVAAAVEKDKVHPSITSSGLLPEGTTKECPCCLMPAIRNKKVLVSPKACC